MGTILHEESDLATIVRTMRTVAVVGIKDGKKDPDAPAYTIPKLLAESGRGVIGINPVYHEALGNPTLATVADLTEAVDVLDVFRRSEALPELAQQLLALPLDRRPRVVWLQTGIRHDDVAGQLAAAGMDVVQDRCLGVYARRYR